jgi:hypothetical protein
MAGDARKEEEEGKGLTPGDYKALVEDVKTTDKP